jgi:hypothetical protein
MFKMLGGVEATNSALSDPQKSDYVVDFVR